MMTWVDLDQTLIASTGCQRSGWSTLGRETWATLRPGARECLARLRGLGRVRLLTSAPLSYAFEASALFALGFSLEDIIAQELWTSYLRDQPTLGRPGDVLVDDEGSPAIPAKCRFIGISPSRVVLVPPYAGGPDDALASVPQRAERLLR